MGQVQKFQQQWELRRRNSHFSSSNDEPESSSSEEPVFKKHKLISDWTSPKADEVGNITRFQPKGSSKGDHFEVDNANKMQIGFSKKEDDPVYNEKERPFYKEDNRMKSNSGVHEPATLDSIRVFMKSILEELKVARENLFIWMREEMHKVMGDDTGLGPTVSEANYKKKIIKVHHQNSFESGSDVRNHNGGTLVGSAKRKRTLSSRSCHEFPADKPDYFQILGSMNPRETGEERLGPSVKGPSFSVSPFDRVGSMNLTPANVSPEACVDNQKLDASSSNYFQARVVGSRMAVNTGKANPTVDSSLHHEGLLEFQKEKFGNIAYMGYQEKNKFTPASRFGTGFPVPLHHGFDGAFKIENQLSMQNLSQVQDNILGPSMDGVGMRSIGGSRGLSEVYVANNLHNHLNSKVDGDAWTHGNSMPRSQRGPVIQKLAYQE